ncbi:sugar transporter [Labilibacter sediminis]|nr:sugar transporter [Labilibacter sediminis]
MILALFLLVSTVSAQNVNPKDVNVEALSDAEIQRAITEMENRGMSEQEAIAIARARGMSESQISVLKRRIEEVKRGSGGQLVVKSGSDLLEADDQNLSEKAKIDRKEVDERIFGFSFFNNKSLSFEPGVNSAISSSYVLGSGDELVVDIWGASQQSYQLIIDRNGNINIPNIGVISVGGLSVEKASTKIRAKLILIYRDLAADVPRTFASINVGQIKSIRVNVIGEVFAPGTYTLSGAATAFNALYLAGGPNKKGSFREIKVIRGGNVVSVLDVYDYLIDGNSKMNTPLSDGDVILVSPYLQKIILEGQLKRTGVFEAKKEETVSDLIRYAGGFTDIAYSHRLELYRKTSRDMVFRDVLENEFDATVVQNGDSIFIGKIINRFQNRVAINGAVYRPGNYELADSLMLSELIAHADGLREDAYVYRGIVTRVKEDFTLQSIAFDVSKVIKGDEDLVLMRDDEVTISSIHDMQEFRTIQIYGEVQNPGVYNYKEGMTLENIIFESGGFLEAASDAFIEVARRLSKEEELESTQKIAHVFQKKVPRNLELSAKDGSFELKAFDKVFIRKLPGYSKQSVVKITGEVSYAGEYALTSKNERISDIIKRTGGLTADAYAEGAILTRKIKVSNKLKRLRKELMARDSTLEFTELEFEVVGINLANAINNPGGKDDIYLMDGDELNIPRAFQTVKISGEVLNPISSYYAKGKKVRDYISEGGGFSLMAKKSKVYVVYPNGAAANTKKRLLFFRDYPKLSPGAEIVVPSKPYREPMTTTAWISMASALASLSLTIVTIVNATNK